MNILQSIQGLWEAEQAMLQTVINVFLQSTVLLSLALLAVLMLRRARPTLQAMVCRAALAGTVVIAAVSLLVGGQIEPTFKLAVPVQAGAVETELPLPAIEAKTEAMPEPAMPQVAAPQVAASPENANIPHAAPVAGEMTPQPAATKRINPYAILGIIWLSGALLLLGWLAFCHAHVLRIRKGCTALREGETFQLLQELSASLKIKAPLLLVNSKVSTPFLTGLWHPAILLPATYDKEFDRPTLRAVLIHELAHLQRHDCRWNLLARFSCALLWPQPLVWMLCRRMEHIAEDVCDQIVVQDGCSPQQYANCLLNLAERLTLRPVERTVGAGVLPVRSALGRRVQQILDSPRRGTTRLSPRLRALVSLAMLSVVAATTMLVTVQVAPGKDQAINAQVLWQSTYSQPVQAVVFSSNSRTLASGSWDHKVRLTDARTGRVLRVLSDHRDRVLSVAFSPTATLLASGSKDRTIKLWNPATGQLKSTLSSEGAVNALAFSPDGKILASGSRNVRLWDARTGKLMRILSLKTNIVHTLAFSPDGKILAAGTQFRTAYLWDVRSGVLLHKLEKGPLSQAFLPRSQMTFYGHSTRVYGVAFAPDGKSLITGCWDGKGRVWDTRTGKLKKMVEFSPPDAGVTALAIAPDGSTLASGSWDVKLWDAQNLQPKRALAGQHPWIKSLAFSRDGTMLASGSWDKTVKVWRIQNGSVRRASPSLVTSSSQNTVQPSATPQPPRIPRGTAAITGRVVYENGKPATGVRVMASMKGNPFKLFAGLAGMEHPGWHSSASAAQKRQARINWTRINKLTFAAGITGQDGSYRLTGITTGTFDVAANGGLPGWVGAAVTDVGAVENKTVQAPNIVLTSGAIIRGTVVDKSTGKPLAGVSVGSEQDKSSIGQRLTKTDQSGRYSMRVPPGKNLVFIVGPIARIKKDIVNMTEIEKSRRVVHHEDESNGRAWYFIALKANNVFYAGEDWAETVLDGGQAQLNRNPQVWTEVQIAKGQTRSLSFRVQKISLKPKKLPQNLKFGLARYFVFPSG